MKMKKKKTTKRVQLVIADPEEKVLSVVKKLADREKRTYGKQAEFMLIKYIEQNKL